MHLSAQQIHRYRHARLAPTELLAIDDHLVTCEFCRLQLRAGLNAQAALRQLRANLQMLPEAEHVSSEQGIAFTHNRLDAVERELVASHLEFCPSCATRRQAWLKPVAAPQPTFKGLLSAGLEFFGERAALLWPMPVVAIAVVGLVSVADNFYFRAKVQAPVPTVTPPEPTPSSPSIATPRPQNSGVERNANATPLPSPTPKLVHRQRKRKAVER